MSFNVSPPYSTRGETFKKPTEQVYRKEEYDLCPVQPAMKVGIDAGEEQEID